VTESHAAANHDLGGLGMASEALKQFPTERMEIAGRLWERRGHAPIFISSPLDDKPKDSPMNGNSATLFELKSGSRAARQPGNPGGRAVGRAIHVYSYSAMWSSSRWNSSRLPNGITIRPAPLLLACTTTFVPSARRSWFSTATI
jgi:hypothetical protein